MHTEDEESTKQPSESRTDASSLGDKISVGDIDDSKAIAIGKDIQQNIYDGFTAEQVSQIIADMHETYASSAPAVKIPAPPEPLKPPAVEQFTGRAEELAAYAAELSDDGFVIVAGMAGVGKTAVAAKLAISEGNDSKVFWHTFHKDEGVETIIWKLAAFLAWHSREDLWNMLQTAASTSSKPPPPDVLFDYLFQLIRGQNYILCFDDFHLVDEDPLLDKLVERLEPAVRAKEIRIIITSRRIPHFITRVDFQPLAGLTLADTHQLLKSHGHTIVEGLLEELHRRTEGNAELLTLTLHALKNTKNPARLLDNLVEAGDIERFLLNQVDNELAEEHRQVMNGVSALLGYSGTRDAIEEVLDGANARRQLTFLTNRYLLQMFEGDEENEYGQHAIVQAFYYDLLSRKQRSEMHARAGAYYEEYESDLLRAALHFERAGNYERAAKLITQDVWVIINNGQARALRNLLERFNKEQLELFQWLKVQLAIGHVCSFLGEDERAQTLSVNILSSIPESSTDEALIRLGIESSILAGDLLQYKLATEAMTYLEHGMELWDELAKISTKSLHDSKVALHIKLGSVHIALGNYKQAKIETEEGLTLAGEVMTRLRADGLTNLSAILYYSGDIHGAIKQTEQSLKLCLSLNEHVQLLPTQSNLSMFRFVAGEWETALEDGIKALALAEHLGSSVDQTRLRLNIGIMQTRKGDFESAFHFLDGALGLSEKFGLTEYKSLTLLARTDLALRQKQAETAIQLVEQAASVVEEMDAEWQKPELFRLRSEALLQIEKNQDALATVQMSIDMAQRLVMELEEGVSLRVLGQAYFANQYSEKAILAFERSLKLLDKTDPYEAARTQFAWGKTLISAGKGEEGNNHLHHAHHTFESLGARFELSETAKLLSSE